jgi:tetratricopeptide (TPR) repeat protein/predicted alpha/beta hydrolase family esterase
LRELKSFGLHCIRECDTDTVIVFVHGILSNGEDAWGSPSWPDLLAAEPELDAASIFVFTYMTSLWSRTYSIADVADNLREHLRLYNLLNKRNIVFVCHSMGGIVVRRFLVANQRLLVDSKPTIGLFLVASPSLGSPDANKLSLLSYALQHTQAATLRFSQANTTLDDLNRDFKTLLSRGELHVEGRELTEDRPITVKRWLGLWRQVVEPFTACQYFHKPGCEPFRVPDADHKSIAKPLHKLAIQHLLLKSFICEFILKHSQSFGRERSLGPQSFVHNPGLCRGREFEIDRLTACLTSTERGAAVLVLGDAGHGKTTITEKVGLRPEVIERFGDRRWFVELERADSAGAALAAVAEAVGLERAAPQRAVEARLGAKPALVILDNLETPLHADTRRTERLLCDLVTINGLALMASVRGRETVAGVSWSDQIWLEPLKPEVARTVFLSIAANLNENDSDLDYFISELDGIPLALKLAAKRASTRPNLAGLRREWERKGALLAAESDGGRSRRDSLLASVEFSLASRRLRESGRKLFSLLGQLPAGLVGNDLILLLGDDHDDAAHQLRQVGLLKDRADRIGLLAPIRDISNRLFQPDHTMTSRWVNHFISLVAEEGQHIGKVGGRRAIARIVPEIPNIEAAISILAAAESSEERAKAVRILNNFGRLMRYTGTPITTALDGLERMCEADNDRVGQAQCKIARAGPARTRSENDLARAEYRGALELLDGLNELHHEADCLWALGDIARTQDDYDTARSFYKTALDLYERVDAPAGRADCSWGLASIARMQHDCAAARWLYEQSRQLYECAGRLTGQADCLCGLASIARMQVDYAAARELYGGARDLYLAAGRITGEADCLLGLGYLARKQDDDETAYELYERARDLYRRAGALAGEADSLRGLGDISWKRNDWKKAQALHEQASDLYQRVGKPTAEADCLTSLGDIAQQQGDHMTARRCYQMARDLCMRAGYRGGLVVCDSRLASL